MNILIPAYSLTGRGERIDPFYGHVHPVTKNSDGIRDILKTATVKSFNGTQKILNTEKKILPVNNAKSRASISQKTLATSGMGFRSPIGPVTLPRDCTDDGDGDIKFKFIDDGSRYITKTSTHEEQVILQSDSISNAAMTHARLSQRTYCTHCRWQLGMSYE